MRSVFATAVLLLLMGCSARECTLEGDYLEATTSGPLVAPEGVSLPPADPSYQIPELPEDSELQATRRYTLADGSEVTDCLDRPPRLPLAAEEAS